MIKISRVLTAHFKNYINTVNEVQNAEKCPPFFFFPLFQDYKNSYSKPALMALAHIYILVTITRCLTKIDTDLLIYQIRGRTVITCPLPLRHCLQVYSQISRRFSLHWLYIMVLVRNPFESARDFSLITVGLFHLLLSRLSWTLQWCHLASVRTTSHTVLYSLKVFYMFLEHTSV